MSLRRKALSSWWYSEPGSAGIAAVILLYKWKASAVCLTSAQPTGQPA